MALMDWDDSFDVKVSKMNDQHKNLVGIMNDLYELNKSGVPRTEILSKLEKLAETTVGHFADEEAYMESINYPDLEVHQGVHKRLLERFTEHFEKFKDSEDAALPQDFFSFLKFWLTSHIQGTDIKYGQYNK